MSTSPSLEQILEAVLFSSPQVLTIRQLCDATETDDSRHLRKIIKKLNSDYRRTGRVFQIKELGGGFQMRTDSSFRPWIQKLEPIKPIKLTLPTIETLAIVAYKQPITRSAVEFIRGVDSSYTLRTLMQRKLIKVVGKEAVPGRPILYGTTRTFLEVFGLKNLNNLPSLSDLDMEKTEEPEGSVEKSPEEQQRDQASPANGAADIPDEAPEETKQEVEPEDQTLQAVPKNDNQEEETETPEDSAFPWVGPKIEEPKSVEQPEFPNLPKDESDE